MTDGLKVTQSAGDDLIRELQTVADAFSDGLPHVPVVEFGAQTAIAAVEDAVAAFTDMNRENQRNSQRLVDAAVAIPARLEALDRFLAGLAGN